MRQRDATLSGAWFVQMRERRDFDRELHRRRCAVLGDDDFPPAGREFGGEARHQFRKRVGTIVRRDYDRGLQMLIGFAKSHDDVFVHQQTRAGHEAEQLTIDSALRWIFHATVEHP